MFLFMLAQTAPTPQTTEGAYLAIIVAIAASAPFLLKGLVGLLGAITKRIQSGTDQKTEEMALVKMYKDALETRTQERDIALAHVERQRQTLQEYEGQEKGDGKLQKRNDELVETVKDLELRLQACQDAKNPASPSDETNLYLNDPLRGETDL